jgi:3-keto-5-aminohexanoate cleavage enzyme
MPKAPQPVIVTAAVTGSITTKEANPGLPVTVEEIVGAVLDCWRAGAAVVHLHARDEEGLPTQDVDRFRLLVEGVRSTDCDAILNLSTGTAGGRCEDFEGRLAPLALDPEMATLDCGSINFGDERAMLGPFPFLRDSATRMKERGIVPEIEVFDSGMIETGIRLIDEGLIEGPGNWQLCVGVRGAASADLQSVAYLASRLPSGAAWGVLGVGSHQLPVNLVSLAYGGHIRTGLEDNVFYRPNELAESNTQLVERAVRFAGEFGRPVATPDQAREILGIGAAS